MEQAEGGPLGAERMLGRHDGGAELLGELRGKAGWLASAVSKAERDAAVRCAGSAVGWCGRRRGGSGKAMCAR